MVSIENEYLIVQVAEKGAELQSVRRKDDGTEYLWNGDPRFWGKHSPVLFPIVGSLKDGQYHFHGKTYIMGRHGFARDTVFTLIEKGKQKLVFAIMDSVSTRQMYPFAFHLWITYELQEERLTVEYQVKNIGREMLYFSIGGHPAFNVPLDPHRQFSDYFLQFSQKENAGIYPLNEEGLVCKESVPFLQNTDLLPLKKSLFEKDALIFKTLESTGMTLKADHAAHGIRFCFEGFPYLGIWSTKGADFVCLEPWDGLSDSETSTGDLWSKEGILSLDIAQLYVKSWSVDFF